MSGLATRGRTPALEEHWQSEIDDAVIALSWGGDRLAAAAVSGFGAVFDSAGSVVAALPPHGLGTLSLAWSAGGRLLASCGQDGMVRVVDAGGGPAWERTTGGRWASQVTWSATAPLLAVASDRSLRVYRDTGDLRREAVDHPSTVTALAWRPRRKSVAAAAYGGVWLWEIDRPVPRILDWTGSVLAMAWSPDGRYLATGDQDATVHFWIVSTGRDLQMSGYDVKVRELAWDSSSRYLATGGGVDLVVWDCSGRGPQGTRPRMLAGHEDLVSALAWQPGGDLLASGGLDGAVQLWRPRVSSQPEARWRTPAAVTTLAWSDDGTLLGVGDGDGRVIGLRVAG